MGLRFPGAAELVAMLGPPGGESGGANTATVAANLIPKPGEDWWQLRVDLMKGRRVNNLQLRGNQITNATTGRTLQTLRGPSKFGRILTTIGKTAIAFGFGYGMGQLGAMLARKAAWATVTGSFAQGTALGVSSLIAPTAMGALWTTAPGARWLTIPLGLGSWAGSWASQVMWAVQTAGVPKRLLAEAIGPKGVSFLKEASATYAFSGSTALGGSLSTRAAQGAYRIQSAQRRSAGLRTVWRWLTSW